MLPQNARVVIIGGGIAGCSVAYHLAKLGWTDIVLLERKQLTSGTTWHAAGLIAQLRATANMTKLAKYSQELYGSLEAETGVATGFKRNGSITLALTEERFEELKRGASMARAYGVEIETISATEAGARHPLLDVKGAVGAVYLAKDGQGDPANIALAMAKGARNRGVRIFENVKVTGITQCNGRVTGVLSDQGPIAAEIVVNCAGMWARDVGHLAGVHAMDSLRIEKVYCHHGHDVGDEDHVLKAGLGFAVKTKKARGAFGNFIDRDAVLKKRETGLMRRFFQFELVDPAPLLYHTEPIVADGKVVSYLTSGAFGHTLGGAIGLGYMPCRPDQTPEELPARRFEIEVAGERIPAIASGKSHYDHASTRIRILN